MGRPFPSFSRLIERERRRWAPFRRALSAEDRAAFDQLFDCVKQHVEGDVYMSRHGALRRSSWPSCWSTRSASQSSYKKSNISARRRHSLTYTPFVYTMGVYERRSHHHAQAH